MRNSAPTTTTGARGSSSAALFPLIVSLPSEGLGLGEPRICRQAHAWHSICIDLSEGMNKYSTGANRGSCFDPRVGLHSISPL